MILVSGSVKQVRKIALQPHGYRFLIRIDACPIIAYETDFPLTICKGNAMIATGEVFTLYSSKNLKCRRCGKKNTRLKEKVFFWAKTVHVQSTAVQVCQKHAQLTGMIVTSPIMTKRQNSYHILTKWSTFKVVPNQVQAIKDRIFLADGQFLYLKGTYTYRKKIVKETCRSCGQTFFYAAAVNVIRPEQSVLIKSDEQGRFI